MATETLEWVEPDGTVTAWPVELLRGLEGRGLPPVKHRLEEIAGRPGALHRSARHDVRRVVVPILFDGGDTAVRASLRQWAARLDSVRGAGKLRVSCVDGATREIPARYAGGLELVEDNAWSQMATVEFLCDDPYWVDTADTTASESVSLTVVTWFPLLPLNFTGSAIAIALTADNDGDVEAWPVITLTGPMTNPTVSNATMGRSLVIANSLAAGETMVLDGRQDQRTITGPAGTSWYEFLASGSRWWPLQRGSNSITLSATSTSGTSTMQLAWRRRWLTV